MRGGLWIEPVTTRGGLDQFITFPFSLYRGDLNWVPPLIEERRDFLDPRKNPFFQHAYGKLFLARHDGLLVGTIGVVIDELANRHAGERAAVFGCFETINDPQVAAALLSAAECWAASQGVALIRGPLNFSTNHELGLLIDGFAEPPMVMTTYNPRYYAPLIEACGYTKLIDLYGYIGDLDERWHNAPPKVFHAAQKAARKEGIRVRKANIHDFAAEVKRVKYVYDRAWVQNWGFVPITEAEADHLATSLRPVLDPDLVFLAEDRHGEPIGVSIALPDLHQALRWSGGGHMFPLGLAKFLWYKRQINQIRLWGIGVVEQYRGRGIDAIFYVETARAALARGHTRIEGSWILETNTMMNRIIERLGGQRYKTYRLYQKPL